MDNLQPLLLNDSNDGGDWKEHEVNAEKVYGRQRKTKRGSEKLFEVTDQILKENIAKYRTRNLLSDKIGVDIKNIIYQNWHLPAWFSIM